MSVKKTPNIKTIDNISPSSVNAGQTAVITMRAGYTRLREHIELQGGLTLADLNKVSLWKNGQIIRELGSGADIDKRNQYYGLPAYADNSILTISHVREGLRRFVETHATGVGMMAGEANSINVLELKLDIDAGANPASAIKSSAEVTDPTQAGMILKETVHTKEFSSNGEHVISDLIQENEQIDCIFLEEEGLTVDELEVRNFNETIHKRTAEMNNHIIKSGGFRTPQTGFYAFDKAERGFGKEPLIATQNSRFELRPVVSGITGSGKIHVRKISFVKG